VALVRTDVSEESIASIIRVTRIGELGTTLAVTSNRHNIPEYGILFKKTVFSSLFVVPVRYDLVSKPLAYVSTYLLPGKGKSHVQY
jgi:hypothetical protein